MYVVPTPCSTPVTHALAEANAPGSQANPSSLASSGIEAQPNSGAYVPLFDFDMAPYNVAMDIVAEALEKLAGTMEPLDLPLPLVGPGYYLEIMVKSPKSPHSPPPLPGQINGINIEGGQAPPVTQIEIILPGESVAQETIKLPSGGVAEITLVETGDSDAQNTAGSISAPEPIPEPGAETNVQPADNTQEGTRSLDDGGANTNSIVGELASDSFLAGQPTGFMSVGATGAPRLTESPTVSGSQLAQPISPESMGPMDTVSGIDFTGDKTTDSDAPSAMEMSKSQPTSKFEESASSTAYTFASTTSNGEEIGGIGGMLGGLYGEQSASQEHESSTETETDIDLEGSSEDDVPSTTFAHSESTGYGFPSSAPIFQDSESVASEIDQATSDIGQGSRSTEAGDTLEATTPRIGEESIASEAMNTSGMTMESMPLPFPPFGGPQQQQELPTAVSTNGSPSIIAETATTSSLASNGGVVETIDIVDASNRYVLESSIDAILHSVMDEYETESIPKAAVGFALIHPRNERMSLL
ncbi:hypothetical protein LPJ81_001464 [Coemansia sp. IMI 209127]|nr:hypothetical protein LPJ81_001464 [Coemansia sp. IMI 209127]